MTSRATPSENNKVWQLERYARLTSDGTAKDDANKWEHFNNSTDTLEMSLVNDQIFIHNGRILLESLSLRTMGKSMRGMSKGDSMLIIYKLKNESRRFRMKFSPSIESSGDVQCRSCVDELTKYFPMKMTTAGVESQQIINSSPDGQKAEAKILEGEVTLGQIAKGILQEDDLQLPSTYHKYSNFSPQSLSTAVRLCLADPTFPDFVDQVEKELDKIKQECT